MVIITWLFGLIVSFVFLYLVIRVAINDSNLKTIGEEFRTTQHQLKRQHEEMLRKLEELKQAMQDKDAGARPPEH